MPEHDEFDGAYTRHRTKIQRGDGVDNRGETVVETVRPVSDHRVDKEKETETVELPGGATTEVVIDSEPFAEHVFEVDRAVQLLEHELGLNDE